MMIHCLSDVWLDHPSTFQGLTDIFNKCVEASMIPRVMVLCGNFVSRGIAQGNERDVRKYQGGCTTYSKPIVSDTITENFEQLGDLIASYPAIARTTHFVFVPGPLDVTGNGVLPRRPILPNFVAKLKVKVPKSHFMSNPCRIKCFGQEIVIFRDDIMSRMLRNLVGAKPDVLNDDLKRYVSALNLSVHFS